MNDFLSSLITQQQTIEPEVKPLIPPLFSTGQSVIEDLPRSTVFSSLPKEPANEGAREFSSFALPSSPKGIVTSKESDPSLIPLPAREAPSQAKREEKEALAINPVRSNLLPKQREKAGPEAKGWGEDMKEDLRLREKKSILESLAGKQNTAEEILAINPVRSDLLPRQQEKAGPEAKRGYAQNQGKPDRTIKVNIGRIEYKSSPSPLPPRQEEKSPPPFQPPITLDHYLANWKRGSL